MSAFIATEQAFPTSRCLSGTDDFWAVEEWCERGTVDGQPARCYYLFSADDIAGIGPEDYPWDQAHVDRVVID